MSETKEVLPLNYAVCIHNLLEGVINGTTPVLGTSLVSIREGVHSLLLGNLLVEVYDGSLSRVSLFEGGQEVSSKPSALDFTEDVCPLLLEYTYKGLYRSVTGCTVPVKETKSWFGQVVDFTLASATIPENPETMTEEKWAFLKRMILDEIQEVDDAFDKARGQVKMIGDNADPVNQIVDLMEEQADGIIDIVYYCLNAASKMGLNFDPLFVEVHRANMDKINPETGKCEKDTDPSSLRFGKVLKPKGWKAPNLKPIINAQRNVELLQDTATFDLNQPLNEIFKEV